MCTEWHFNTGHLLTKPNVIWKITSYNWWRTYCTSTKNDKGALVSKVTETLEELMIKLFHNDKRMMKISLLQCLKTYETMITGTKHLASLNKRWILFIITLDTLLLIWHVIINNHLPPLSSTAMHTYSLICSPHMNINSCKSTSIAWRQYSFKKSHMEMGWRFKEETWNLNPFYKISRN